MSSPFTSLSRLSSRAWFATFVAAICLWILLLPIFPTQDGPMHRYYVHVLHSLLQHQQTYGVYAIRHPVPPYMTHYAAWLMLFHLLPYDLAEKIFDCLLVICLAYGVRMSAKQIGPLGEWVSLLVLPVLLAWPLMMGFFNFFLGVGLLFFCTAWWQKLRVGSLRPLWVLGPLLILLTLTHPIPLLLLIVISALDLAAQLFFPDGQTFAARLRLSRGCLIAFVLMLVAAAFPALAVNSAKTGNTLSLIGFHADYFRTSLLLSGVSPYNTRSLSVWINLYRLVLYAVLISSLWLGARGFLSSVRERRVRYGAVFFVATVLLLLLLPFTPNNVNGSEYFSTRLVFVLWPGALLAASLGAAPSAAGRRRWIIAGAACCLLTLVPAQIFIRPMGSLLRQAELQPLPKGVPGVLLIGDGIDDYARFQKNLGFDPLKWGAVLAVVHANDVVLDSPWTDLTITPVASVPGGPEVVADISYAGMLHPPEPNAPAVPGRSLPAWAEARTAQAAGFMILTAPPPMLTHGLADQLTPAEAAKFACGAPHGWYLVCVDRHLPNAQAY